MTLCFVDPADAIRAIADSVGREARRQLLGEAVRAWVDEIPTPARGPLRQAIPGSTSDIVLLPGTARWRSGTRSPTATS
jgi:hypothetical protein